MQLNALSNAMAESFFATLECELIDRRSFQTQAEARMAIFEYLESWYNTRRLHSALGYLSPNEFERRAAARRPMGTAGHREQTNLEPFRIGRPGIPNHPPGRPSTPVSERDLIPSAIVHPSAGGDSPQPSTESYVDAPLVGKHDVERRAACGSGTVVCPASRMQPFSAAGLYGFREIGSRSG